MKILTKILNLIFLFTLVTHASHAQLMITEVQSFNSELNFDSEEPDWVEIYNSGNTDIDLLGYCIKTSIKKLIIK